MFVYNVTFIHSYWHMTTTIESEYDIPSHNSEEWDHIVQAASEWIHSTCGFDPIDYANVDIDVEYSGVAF